MSTKERLYNFDAIIDRQGTDCVKYDLFDDPDVMSLWVADMDFESPPSIVEGLRERLDHGVFGYALEKTGTTVRAHAASL